MALLPAAGAWSPAAVLLTIASQLIGPAQALILGWLVSAVLSGASLTVPLAAFVAFFCARQLIETLTESVSYVARRRVDGRQRHDLRLWLAQDPTVASLESEGLQSDLRRIGDVSIGRAVFAQVAWLAAWTGVLASTLLVARVSVVAAGVVLVVSTVTLNRARRIAQDDYQLVLSTLDDRRRQEHVVDLARTAAKELRVFGWADWLLERREAYWRGWFDPQCMMWKRLGRLTCWSFGIQLAVLIGLAAWAILQAVPGSPERAGELVAFLLAMESLLFRRQPEVSVIAARDILGVRRRLGLARHRSPSNGTEYAQRRAAEVQLVDVSFSYPGAERPVLEGIDLALAPGSATAVVGVNGAGKTTLVKLLCGLYRPTEGQVVADGALLDERGWGDRLAVVFQDFVKLPLPLRANIVLDHPDREDVLQDVLASAHLDELVAKLPQGIDTLVSTQFKGGVDLSGGEWQRVALARALYAAAVHADLIVLDEPTANLDVRTELAVFETLLAGTRKQTTLLVSHRLSSVRRCDRIVVLHGGRLIEDGSHEELLMLDGHYASMFRAQAEGFTVNSGA
ncbi:MAG: ATP-binding cassette domain-containing protein [Nocardioidaceae bacterium]